MQPTSEAAAQTLIPSASHKLSPQGSCRWRSATLARAPAARFRIRGERHGEEFGCMATFRCETAQSASPVVSATAGDTCSSLACNGVATATANVELSVESMGLATAMEPPTVAAMKGAQREEGGGAEAGGGAIGAARGSIEGGKDSAIGGLVIGEWVLMSLRITARAFSSSCTCSSAATSGSSQQ
jgi:hypothetical protein